MNSYIKRKMSDVRVRACAGSGYVCNQISGLLLCADQSTKVHQKSHLMDSVIDHCQFQKWYPLFKKLTTRTRILEAPEEFREYLASDGIVLHEDFNDATSDWETDVPEESKIAEVGEGDISIVETMTKPPLKFHEEIEKTIKELNGEVAPKLNWSSPVDATWILPGNTMRCTNANDVYMLLKSSDYINHDLQLHPPTLTLVLREWFDIHPSNEFRCFVKSRQLLGISQRDMNYYDFLAPASSLIENLCLDMSATIARDFPDESFVFDVYISKSFKEAWLIDINPWLEKTDSLLFNWNEFDTLDHLEVRLIEKEDRSRTFNTKPHSSSQVPFELVDMDQGAMQEMLEIMKQQRKKEEEEEKEEEQGR